MRSAPRSVPPRAASGILGVLIKDARPLRLHDLAADPRAAGVPPSTIPDALVSRRSRSCCAGSRTATSTSPRSAEAATSPDDDQEVTTLLAAQAAVAIGNARRIERDALARVVSAQEVERRRLARELHDGTGQALTSILLGLSAVEHADSLESVRRAVAPLRELVVADAAGRPLGSRSSSARRRSTTSVSGRRCAASASRCARRTASRCRSRSDSAPSRLPADVETAVYRIVQEALANVLRHADAERVSIVATRRAGSVSLVIEDDGQGFDTTAPADGMGLVGDARAREPARRRCSASSRRPGAGTTIVVDLPLPTDGSSDDPDPDRRRPRGRALRAAASARARGRLRGRRPRPGTADEGVRAARLEKPDVVLLDVVMPGRSGLEAAEEILGAAKAARILVLSMQDDPTYVREAFAAGASGYMLKEAADTELVAGDPRGGLRRPLRPSHARARGWPRPRSMPPVARPTIRCPSGSARCCACSRSGTRTRRSRSSSSSRCAPPRRTARTSCRSSGSAPAQSSCVTRSRTGCSTTRRPSSVWPGSLRQTSTGRPALPDDRSGHAAEEEPHHGAVAMAANRDQARAAPRQRTRRSAPRGLRHQPRVDGQRRRSAPSAPRIAGSTSACSRSAERSSERIALGGWVSPKSP